MSICMHCDRTLVLVRQLGRTRLLVQKPPANGIWVGIEYLWTIRIDEVVEVVMVYVRLVSRIYYQEAPAMTFLRVVLATRPANISRTPIYGVNMADKHATF